MQTHRQAVGWKSGNGTLGEPVEQTNRSGAALEGVEWIEDEVESPENGLMPSDASGPQRSGRVDGHLSKRESWEEGSDCHVTCGEFTAAPGSTGCCFSFSGFPSSRLFLQNEGLMYAEVEGATTFPSENNRCPREDSI